MRKAILLSKAEMRKVTGGNPPPEIGCYVVCRDTDGNHPLNNGNPFSYPAPDCSEESKSLCTFAVFHVVERCVCLTGPGGGGEPEA